MSVLLANHMTAINPTNAPAIIANPNSDPAETLNKIYC